MKKLIFTNRCDYSVNKDPFTLPFEGLERDSVVNEPGSQQLLALACNNIPASYIISGVDF